MQPSDNLVVHAMHGGGKVLVIDRLLYEQPKVDDAIPLLAKRSGYCMLGRFRGGEPMNFNVRLFKDVAIGLDKLVGALGKLGNLLIGAAHNGVAAIDYITAARVLYHLEGLNPSMARLSQHQSRILRPTLRLWLKYPTQDAWHMFLVTIADTRLLLVDVSKRLKKTESAISTEPFFPDLVGSVMVREKLINQLLKTPPPETAEEKEAATDFIIAYDKLINELTRLVEIVADYTDALRKKRVWPKQLPELPPMKEFNVKIYAPATKRTKKKRPSSKKASRKPPALVR